ncbi:MAG: 6-bladed beta-propeller [Candidatus Aminicenantales bacterium]
MKKVLAAFLGVILTLLVLSLVSGCKKKGLEWKGSVETIDGVQVIMNPKEPLFPGGFLSVVEELNIGKKEGPEEYRFSMVRSLDVDVQEQIYVLDSKESIIRVYDREGHHLRSFGKPGQGPGELERPRGISIYDSQVLVAEIGRKLSVFSLEGEFIRRISTKEYWVLSARCDSAGNIIVTEGHLDPDKPLYRVLKFDPEMNLLFKIAESPAPNAVKGFNPFMAVSYWTVDYHDCITYGYPADYTIQVFSPEGKLLRKIRREYDPVPISEEEKKEFLREERPPQIKITFSKYHSAFRRFLIDEEGRLYVQSWEKDPQSGHYFYDVFDPEGRYLTRVPLKGRPVVCYRGKLYSIDEDEEGYPLVKRYRLIWQEDQD